MEQKTYKKVVLAYSGGLDTSVIIRGSRSITSVEVIAVAADVGQGSELDGLREKAIKTGASKIYIEDLTEAFVDEFIVPTLKAGAVYEENTCSALHSPGRSLQSVLLKSLKGGRRCDCARLYRKGQRSGSL